MAEQLNVAGKAQAVRRIVNYRGTEPLPLRVAVAVALVAHRTGKRISIGYREQWCDGRDPAEFFLLGVDPGSELVLEASGPDAVELIDEVQKILEGE